MTPPALSMPHVTIRPNPEGSIDEIVAENCALHIEQLSDHGYSIVITSSDGGRWSFYCGAKNHRSHVELTHVDTEGPEQP